MFLRLGIPLWGHFQAAKKLMLQKNMQKESERGPSAPFSRSGALFMLMPKMA